MARPRRNAILLTAFVALAASTTARADDIFPQAPAENVCQNELATVKSDMKVVSAADQRVRVMADEVERDQQWLNEAKSHLVSSEQFDSDSSKRDKYRNDLASVESAERSLEIDARKALNYLAASADLKLALKNATDAYAKCVTDALIMTNVSPPPATQAATDPNGSGNSVAQTPATQAAIPPPDPGSVESPVYIDPGVAAVVVGPGVNINMYNPPVPVDAGSNPPASSPGANNTCSTPNTSSAAPAASSPTAASAASKASSAAPASSPPKTVSPAPVLPPRTATSPASSGSTTANSASTTASTAPVLPPRTTNSPASTTPASTSPTTTHPTNEKQSTVTSSHSPQTGSQQRSSGTSVGHGQGTSKATTKQAAVTRQTARVAPRQTGPVAPRKFTGRHGPQYSQ